MLDCLSFQKATGETNTYLDEIFQNGILSVDTFFYLGGLLVTYMTLGELEKNRYNFRLALILRYIRLTIPLAFAIGYVSTLLWPPINGPMSELLGSETGCSENWWRHIIYINGYEYT